jgi:hypothetical protein
MPVGRYAAAYEAGLPENELTVFFITQANGLSQNLHHCWARLILGAPHSFVARPCIRMESPSPCPLGILAIAERGKPLLKLLLDYFGVCCCECILRRQIPKRPRSCLIRRIYKRQLLNEALPKARR